jgi:hypothetical protein
VPLTIQKPVNASYNCAGFEAQSFYNIYLTMQIFQNGNKILKEYQGREFA